jgi:putative endonuclease
MLFLIRRRLLNDSARLGRWGERRCERYLRSKGLRPLARNYSCKVGELDLVMVDADGSLVFVEFAPEPTRASARRGDGHSGQEDPRGPRRPFFLAAHNNIQDRPLRFDVVTLILGRRGPPQIRHYERAFVP